MREVNCLLCGAQMKFVVQENLQLGKTGWILGDLPNLFAGALMVDFYVCPECSKLELFLAGDGAQGADDELPKKVCPNCGKEIDFDSPKCPYCRHQFWKR